MIRFLSHQQIDRTKWDACVLQSGNGQIYGCSWYLDVVCPAWDGLIQDDYVAVMPLTRGRKFLMEYVYPPFFCQQLGVFTTDDAGSAPTLFLPAIPSAIRFVEMNLNAANQFVPANFRVKSNLNYVLDVSRSYEEIRKNYSENHERNIRKAAKNGSLKIREVTSPDAIINLFRANRGRFVTNLKEHHYEVFSNLVRIVQQHASALQLEVSDEQDMLVAGAVFFEWNGRSVFIFSGISSDGKRLSAMHFLIDWYIQRVAGRFKVLDFEGSNDPELARFYRGFGSTECVYLQVKYNSLPPPWKWFKN